MKHSLKILCSIWVVLLIGFFLPDMTFANDGDVFKDVYDLLDKFIRILAWFWIVPASIAGNLLWNEWVYGEVFNFNVYLWKMRQIMRTFSNFVIWWLFLWFILQSIFTWAVSDLGSRLARLWLWALLVNMSWLLMAAIIDLSMAATAAVSSLPVIVLEPERDKQEFQIQINEVYKIDEHGARHHDTDSTNQKPVSLWDILPHADNMSWPIVYMWWALLWFLSADLVDVNLKNWETISLTTAIKILVLILFIIPVVLLVIVNAIRIFWIWLWIIFSPFIFLDVALGDFSPIKAIREDNALKVGSHLWNLLWLVFQPVVVVWALWLWLILMTWIMQLVNGWEAYEDAWRLNEIQISWNPATLETNWVSVWIDWSLFKDIKYRTLWFFGETILSFFGIFLLRWIVKLGFSFSEVTKAYTDEMLSTWANIAKSLPIIPVFKWQSINSLSNQKWNIARRATWYDKIKQQIDSDAEKYSNKLSKWVFGIDMEAKQISAGDATDISRSIAKSSNFKKSKADDWFWTLMRKWVTWKEAITYTWKMKSLVKEWFGSRTAAQFRSAFWANFFPKVDSTDPLIDVLSSWSTEDGRRLANFIEAMLDWADQQKVLAASDNISWSDLSARRFERAK